MADPSDVYIGVDIGGTKVAAGLVNSRAKFCTRRALRCTRRGTADEALGSVRAAIDAAFGSESRTSKLAASD